MGRKLFFDFQARISAHPHINLLEYAARASGVPSSSESRTDETDPAA